MLDNEVEDEELDNDLDLDFECGSDLEAKKSEKKLFPK
jgi:hypothetical protein